jgi:hypothetical protein
MSNWPTQERKDVPGTKTVALLVLILLVIGVIVHVQHACKCRSDDTTDGGESGAMSKSKLEKALEESKLAGGSLEAALNKLNQYEIVYEIVKEEEVKALAEALDQYRPIGPRPKESKGHPVMYSVCSLMQGNKNVPGKLVREHLVPHVLRLLDHHVGHRDVDKSDVLFCLKVLSLYGNRDAVSWIKKLSQEDWIADGYLWSVVFEVYDFEDHPHRADLVNALRDPLPKGFAAVAYLNLVNTLARENKITGHPFDNPSGHKLLQGWLTSKKEDDEDYAISTVAAIPFLSPPRRDQLLALADKHPSPLVGLEAAWANVRLGNQKGVKHLVDACLDPSYSKLAIVYLEELELTDKVPEAAQDPEFRAKAEMASWLAHPMEYGRPPSKLDLFDKRKIFWPPTNDRRQVYLFKYEYPPKGKEGELDVGIGMVGSITFALFGESTADKSPAEVYALHCAWELETNKDPRAPSKRTVESGLKILRRHNPDMADFAAH